jgi:hypothetical protein
MEKVAGCNPILTLGGRVRQGVTLAVLAVAGVAAGLYFGWNSLAALGLTGVIVSLLPCLLMCAAGVCMSRMGGKEQTESDAGANSASQGRAKTG